MFEKDAEIYADKNKIDVVVPPYGNISNYYELKKGFKDGAEFGYNKAKEEMQKNGLALQSDMDKTIEQNIALKKELEKANEWHYVKDGDLPKDTTSLYLVRVYSWDFGLSHLYKKYGKYIPIVCEWKGEHFSALDEMAYYNARNIKNCIAWKEIVLPELPKEIKEID